MRANHSDSSMGVEDASTELPAALPQVGSDATAAPGSALGSQLLRDNLNQGFEDDAIALRDRYILDDVLAVGASYIVYKARDPRRGGNSNVAIKALRPELRGDSGAIERLRREFRFCAALRHPNIVRVFALEEVSGIWFMVMECLVGTSLARLIYDGRPKPVPIPRALSVLRACSAVLSVMHERRIVHRDFNPGNVWITESGEVRVIGFGASQRCALPPGADFANDETRCQRKLSCASTSAYASPQLLAGEQPEPGDDVFSFACIAYELLVGRHPFGRWSVAEIAAQHLRIERPPGWRQPVWRALREGMQRRSERRTRSAADLLLDLERGLTEETAGVRGSVVEAMRRHLQDARRWFEARPIRGARALLSRQRFRRVRDRFQAEARQWFLARRQRVVERTVSLGEWFASRQAEIAKAARTVRRSAARLPSFANFSRRPGNEPSQGEGRAEMRRPRATLLRAIVQTRHLRSVPGSKRVRTMRAAQRMVGSWCEIWRGGLKRARPGKEWVVGAQYLATGAAALALACLILVHGKSTLTEIRGRAQMREFGALSAPWVDDSLVGFASDRSGEPATSAHVATHGFGSEDDCAIGSDGISSRLCASESTVAASDVRSSAAGASVRPAHRPSARVALERAALAVSDRAIAAALVITRVGSVGNPVMVRWRTVGGTAKPDEDYEGVISGTARFIDNQSVRVLYVPLKSNPKALGDRYFTVELIRPSSGAVLGQISRVVVTIQKRE